MSEQSAGPRRDLWGRPFTGQHVVPEAVRLLKEQALALDERTGGRVSGDVREGLKPDGKVWVGLWARVPALRDFEYKLVTLAYPAAAPNPDQPFPMAGFDSDGRATELHSRDEYIEWLTGMLSSDGVHNLIERLMGQAPADERPVATHS